jgi:Wiskott-Aldrich syndrome protein
MDEDVDMDAPQISTLREEVTPPPAPKSASASRRNKTSTKPRTADFPTWTRPVRKEPQTEEEFDEPEEEEDQLIDDDDMKPIPPAALSASRSGDSTSKRKSPAKKKPRKNDKRVVDDGKNAGEKAVPTQSEAPPLTWLASEQQQHDDVHAEQPASTDAVELVPPQVVSPKKPPPKVPKAKPPKPPTATTSKAKAKPSAKYDIIAIVSLYIFTYPCQA